MEARCYVAAGLFSHRRATSYMLVWWRHAEEYTFVALIKLAGIFLQGVSSRPPTSTYFSDAHAHSSRVRGVCKPSMKRIQGTPGHNGITKAVPLIPSLPHPHSDSIERRYLAQLRSFSVNPPHPSTCTQTFLYCSGAPELSCFIKGCCREDIVRL